jgi:monoterpene epsilon-lactone hydrolase
VKSTERLPVLHLPARDIPMPAYLSPRARAILAQAVEARNSQQEQSTEPALDDAEGWRRFAATGNDMMIEMMAEAVSKIEANVSEFNVNGVTVYDLRPPEVDESQVFLEIHGGGLTLGYGAACRARGLIAAERMKARTWAVDYRMPPDHPYPAPLDDCVATYRTLLLDHDPPNVIVGGWSAGGNLAAALILRARDEGLPLPAAAVLLSPMADLTQSGDSFFTNGHLDTRSTGGGFSTVGHLYAGGHELDHPYVSPLFGDFSKGFPPTILTAGTRDLFLSNTVRLHRSLRKAGVAADLHIMDASPHGGFGGAPEDDELAREVCLFVDAQWRR